MSKMKLEDLIKVLKYDVIKNNSCVELNFCIDNDSQYENCYIGKMPSRDAKSKELYWYGLSKDGSQSYCYDNLKDILNAKVFNCKSICEIMQKVTWYSLDGCSIEDMLPYYISD